MTILENSLKQIIKEALLEALASGELDLSNRPTQPPEDSFLDAPASAAFIGESLSSFYRRTSNKELPHYKRGKRIFCKQSELKTWLEAGKQPTRNEVRQSFS